MDISKNIKTVREERKISQSEIARHLGVEPTNYPRMEKRGKRLTIEQLEKIAEALGVSVVELLTGEPQVVAVSNREKELEKRIEELERDKTYYSKIIDVLSEKSDLQEKAYSETTKSFENLVVELEKDGEKLSDSQKRLIRLKHMALKARILSIKLKTMDIAEE